MDKDELARRLTDLHIKVLGQILKGEPFEFIREKFNKQFSHLNYEEIMVEKAHRLTFDDSGMLIGAYPVSPLPTSHKLTVGGIGTGYAMCAIDALGATHTFSSPVTIESKFSDSGEPLQLTLSAKDIPETSMVVSYNPLNYDSLQDLVAANSTLATDACPSINFYSSKEVVPEGLKTLDFASAIKESYEIFSKEAIKNHIRAALD